MEAIQLGAVDFLEKPLSQEGLRARVAQLQEIWRLKEENKSLKSKMEFQFGFDRLVGNSTGILKLKEMIVQVGPTDAGVLIQGETGTGKELVARAIHHHSPRSQSPFVPVDCGAITETVIESELFGHEKGAFTGAHAASQGLIRSADKGTLFLDEVGELPLAMQVKLLRAVQEKEVRPVGSSRSFPVDVRVIAATNRELSEEVARGSFRKDLYYRLNILEINIPPLRSRQEDISELAQYYVTRFCTEFSSVRDISPEVIACLENHDWPGNIRELENVMRRAIALGKSEAIQLEDLPVEIYSPPSGPSSITERPSSEKMESYEKAAILNALAQCGNNRREAARVLEIGEATLYRKIRKYQIDLKKL